MIALEKILLAEVLLSTQSCGPRVDTLLSAERLTAIAALISSLAWPLVGFLAALAFRPQLMRLADHVTEFKAFGVEAKIDSTLKEAAADAAESLNKGVPTAADIARSVKVDDLTSSSDIQYIRGRVAELATYYERTRASQPPGDARTRAMEAIVVQMRVIGRAASLFRYELTSSPSPGRRLQAIASLQCFRISIFSAGLPNG